MYTAHKHVGESERETWKHTRMVNIPRSFLASLRTISNTTTNANAVYEAMKRVCKTSLEYKHSIYVKNFFARLKDEKIGTTTVESLSQRLCSTLPGHRKRTLVGIVNSWKLEDAHKELRKWKRLNTSTWRKEEKVIRDNNLSQEFERLWRREVTKYTNELKSRGDAKMRHLTSKYKQRTNTGNDIPDNVQGIIVADQELDDTFTSTPRTYGGVTLNE